MVSLRQVRRCFDRWLYGTQCPAIQTRAVAEALRAVEMPAFVLGGAVRDVVIGQGQPRDVDVVIDAADTREVISICRTIGLNVLCSTRFGGIRASIGGVMFDVWALRETWSFRSSGLKASFADLPATTPLDIQAIALELLPEGRAFEAGFLHAIQSRRIERTDKPALSEDMTVNHARAISKKTGFHVVTESWPSPIERLTAQTTSSTDADA